MNKLLKTYLNSGRLQGTAYRRAFGFAGFLGFEIGSPQFTSAEVKARATKVSYCSHCAHPSPLALFSFHSFLSHSAFYSLLFILLSIIITSDFTINRIVCILHLSLFLCIILYPITMLIFTLAPYSSYILVPTSIHTTIITYLHLP